jgi:TonB family protein
MEKRNQRNLLLALVILLVTLGIALAKNHDFWFGSNETQEAENTAPVSNPAITSKTVAPAAKTLAPVQNPAAAKNHSAPAANAKNEVVAKDSAPEAAPEGAVIEATPAEVPPLEVEVVAGDSHRAVHPGSNSVLVIMPPKSGFRTPAAAFKWSPLTNVSERTRISSGQEQFEEATYPALARQMKVKGSVLLQASVGADGDIKDLRVLSGNPILTSAAKEAARQWRFKPSLQHGQPVETKQQITVNFTIRVL